MAKVAKAIITKIWSDMGCLGKKTTKTGDGFIYCLDIQSERGGIMPFSRAETREELIETVLRLEKTQPGTPIPVEDELHHFSLAHAHENMDTEAVRQHEEMMRDVQGYVDRKNEHEETS